MDAAAEKRWPGILTGDFPSTTRQIPAPSVAGEACAEVREALVLIAAKEVAQAANRVFSAVLALENNQGADSNFQDWNRPAITALTDFRKAARAELLPT
jgi:isopentenyl diphosphate isomerase/L-lactate dehydrogenase-like FMN-dependent dehydrogenase